MSYSLARLDPVHATLIYLDAIEGVRPWHVGDFYAWWQGRVPTPKDVHTIATVLLDMQSMDLVRIVHDDNGVLADVVFTEGTKDIVEVIVRNLD